MQFDAVKKIVTVARTPVKLNITGVTLLSAEEANNIPEKLRVINKHWWLRSPGHIAFDATFVAGNDDVYLYNDIYRGDYCVDDSFGVRPALKIDNLESSGLAEGDEIEVVGHTWTVIPGGMLLCNGIVGHCVFRTYKRTDDKHFYDPKDGKRYPLNELNDYEHSEVKKFLEDWAVEHSIIEKTKALPEHKTSLDGSYEELRSWLINSVFKTFRIGDNMTWGVKIHKWDLIEAIDRGKIDENDLIYGQRWSSEWIPSSNNPILLDSIQVVYPAGCHRIKVNDPDIPCWINPNYKTLSEMYDTGVYKPVPKRFSDELPYA